MRLSNRLLLFSGLLLPALLFSQAKLLKQADSLFNANRYKEAYALYNQVKTKKENKEILLKKADCNYHIENYKVAQGYYSKYFADTLFHPVPQYTFFANASRLTGKLDLAYNLYSRINNNGGGDDYSRSFVESCRLYLDSANKIKVYDLDMIYTCIELDASESHDSVAAPMTYVWDFKDGTVGEGIKVTHCFQKPGENRITLSIRDKATGFMRTNDTSLIVIIESPPVTFTCTPRLKQYFYTKFDASSLAINNYEILEYIWETGDNNEIVLGKKAEHKYDKLDFYTIKLTVVAKDKVTGKRVLFASSRRREVVDNYSDHSKTFKDEIQQGQ